MHLKPLISVVVPVYNAETFLRECIQSVVLQTFKNWELVLVNDGSQDGSGSICDELAREDSRVHVIHQENSGPTIARTVGANSAQGDYVIFLDSDDYIAADLLAELENIISVHSPDVIIYDGKSFSENQQTVIRCLMESGLYEKERLSIVRDHIILNGQDEISITYGVCMKAFRRELYLPYQNSVPKELYKGEDLAVCAPLIADAERVYVSDFCGYYYRDNPNSIMHSFCVEEIAQIKIAARYLKEKMGKEFEDRINVFVATHYFDYLDRAMFYDKKYRSFKKRVRETMDDSLRNDLKKAKSRSTNSIERLIVFLLRKQWFFILWALRRVKPRRG